MIKYFEQNADKFSVDAPGIRNCQRGAYYATLAHFTRSTQPCLIGLPTGSGKTALMMALCFGLRARRVLIITPARILRSQTSSKFKTLDDLKAAQALPQDASCPEVMEVLHQFHSTEDWDECQSFDVMVATPKTTSPREKGVHPAPKGFFDVLFIDEGHHSPASTWAALLEWFAVAGTKAILLTGTPYRRDRIEIKAELIYDYPISLAIQDNIYAPVRFADAGKTIASRDRKLAKKALRVRDQVAETYSDKPLMLIKTDRIKHANELCKLYQGLGANVLAIHTRVSQKGNEEILQDLRGGKLDGIVAVGMVGEGLDVPQLKIAVFHRNPQSLPHTIQVIGRLARTSTKIAQGTVVGFADDFSRETFALYDASPDWFRLIPDLERRLIAGRVGVAGDESLLAGQNFLYDSDLTPFFSISAFQCKGPAIPANVNAIRAWASHGRDSRVSVERVSTFENDTFVIVTKSVGLPSWLRSGGYSRVLQTEYDLHLFFQYEQLILQHTTNSQAASTLRGKLFPGELQSVRRDKLNHALSSGDGSYIVVGLRNSSGFSQANPSYKMLLGVEAQAAVTNADTKAFHTGHCLMRLRRFDRQSEVRGIAYKSGKVWALKRDNLREFRQWCFRISRALLKEGIAQLPGLERLRSTERVSVFTEKPLAVVPDTALLPRLIRFIRSEEGKGLEYSGWPDVMVKRYDSTKIICRLPDLEVSFAIELDEDGEVHHSIVSGPAYIVQVDPVDGVLKTYPTLASFLEEFPPGVIFVDGSTLTDGLYSRPVYIPELDSEVVQAIEWAGCDIHSETSDTESGISVQRFIETRCIPSQAKDIVIIRDHGSGEIADIISLDLLRKAIALYHAKSAKVRKGRPQKPGGRQSDLQEVLSQATCSGRWVRNVGFAAELYRRVDQRSATVVVQGNRSQVAAFSKEYEPAAWSFEVVVAQPAFRVDKMSDPIRAMIAGAQDYIGSAGAEFRLICSG